VAARTRQKHDYPSQAWRASYARRTAAERLNASIKDPAVNSISQGWIRLMGLTPLLLWLSCLMVVRNQRTLNAFQDRPRPRARRCRTAARPQTPPRTRRHPRRPALTSPGTQPHGSSHQQPETASTASTAHSRCRRTHRCAAQARNQPSQRQARPRQPTAALISSPSHGRETRM
jgi:hypothetical protein